MSKSFSNFLISLKPYTLIISVVIGFLVFIFFHYFELSKPLRPAANIAGESLPIIIFFILFFAFSKITLKEMKPSAWHYILVTYQVMFTLLLALYLYLHPQSDFKSLIEGVIICVITPTAASASVITGKLGGNESALTSYIIISNLASAIAIPLFFPLFCNLGEHAFLEDILMILGHTFPILVLPLFLTFVIRTFAIRLHQFILIHTKELGFYLWAFIVMVVSARTFANIVNSQKTSLELTLMVTLGFFLTVSQFALGKVIGNFGHQRISAGQAVGQKNMIFGIWVTLIYLTPEVAIIPGTCIIWQNVVNSWQLWYRVRNLKRWEEQGQSPYQE